MKILLGANAAYVPPRGGSTRSNLVWLDHLAAHGHTCRVVAAAAEKHNAVKYDQLQREISEQEIDVSTAAASNGVEVFRRGPIEVHSVLQTSKRAEVLREQIRQFQPDWVLISSEDLAHVLLREAHESAPGRVVYLAHTPQFYPFGPASWYPDKEAARLVARSAAIIAIGHTTARYIEKYAGRRAEVVHPPIYGSGPFPNLASFHKGYVGMINPCAVKGISIFQAIARMHPEYDFAALPGWGTTTADRAALQQAGNITVLASCKNIEQFLSKTRVLLMPSLWLEGFGLIVMEAMLRGIPVIASDSGGLVEAKIGTDFIVPVRSIERYEQEFDEHGMPKAVIPEQEMHQWSTALTTLLSDPVVYQRESDTSRSAAMSFVAQLHASRFEELLQGLGVSSEPSAAAPVASDPLEHLSPEKRALLLSRLKKRGSTHIPG
jgi:glycosyltransferase involved in cell wall biosynthesis